MSCASNLINQFLRGQWAHTKKRQPAGETQKQNHKTLDLESWRLKIFGTRRQLVWTYKCRGRGSSQRTGKRSRCPHFPQTQRPNEIFAKKISLYSLSYNSCMASRISLLFVVLVRFQETWPSLASFFDQILCPPRLSIVILHNTD